MDIIIIFGWIACSFTGYVILQLIRKLDKAKG